MADALARLDACGADAELIALAKDCLAREPEDRPRDAERRGRADHGLPGGRAGAAAGGRARAGRGRGAGDRGAAAAQGAARAGGVGPGAHDAGRAEHDVLPPAAGRTGPAATEQAAAIDRVVGQADTLRDQARANPEDLSRWQVALAAVEQAEAAGDAGAAPRLLALRTEVQAGLDAAQRDKALLDRLVDIRSAEADDPDGSITDRDYADAFREAGIDLATLPPAEAGAKIKARPAVGGYWRWPGPWTTGRRSAGADEGTRPARCALERSRTHRRSRSLARRAAHRPGQADKAARHTALQALAKKAKYDELGPISLHLLGTGLSGAGDRSQAQSVLRKAQQRHPRRRLDQLRPRGT